MLLARSLKHYWRSHLAVFLGVVVTTMVLVGSLLVGDVVRLSLRRLAERRLGRTELAVAGAGRLYREALAGRLQSQLADDGAQPVVAPVMQLKAVVALPGDPSRSANVNLFGVTPAFWQLGAEPASVPEDGLALSERTAAALGLDAASGEEVVLRVQKPSWLGGDVLMSSDARSDTMINLSLEVAAVVGDRQMGIFSLAANQVAPLNVYVPLSLLQAQGDELAERCNMFLLAGAADELAAERVDAALAKVWQLEDVGLELIALEDRGVELRSKRIFLSEQAVVEPLADRAHPVFTYFVIALGAGEREAVYSMVSAVEPQLFAESDGPAVPADWSPDEALINQWTADELGVGVGDTISIAYWTMGEMRTYVEHEQEFTVAAVLPIEDLAADRDLMPDFPGITGSASCREFDAPVPIDFDRIEDSDNAYWMEYRGTPKGFIRLERGRELWRNRYGATTQLRFVEEGDTLASVRAELRRTLAPRDLGLFALDVRERALGSVSKSVDLGEYFLGMSSFLIGAALLLTVLLFAFAMEQRRREFGLLLALGFTHKRTRRQFLKEAMLVAAGGVVLGTGLGIGYTWLLTDWISSGVWQAAVGGVQLEFAITPTRVLLGAIGVWLLAVLVLDRSLRRLAGQQAVALLRGRAGAGAVHRHAPGWVLHLGWILVVAGLALGLIGEPDPAAAMRFFGSGAALLVGGICLAIWWLRRLGERRPERQRGLAGLSLANAARRPGRSLTVVAVLASAAFLTLAVGAMYRDASFNRWERRSGTGGFAFMGSTSLPVLHDLDSAEGRKEYGITAARFARWARSSERFDVDFADRDPFAGLGFVQMRSTEGDDASCLNLNRSQQPRLWGVDSAELAERGAFSFGAVIDGGSTDPQRAWRLLQQRRTVTVERGGETVEVPAVPAIAESNAATYAMGIGIGDTIIYTDEAGFELVVVLVGTVTNAMLQGGLLIEEDLFVDHFPSRSGYTTFLVDYGHHGGDELAAVQAYFERRLQDVGLELESAAERLEQLYAMQNVYLGIFQILGALGLLLGSMGLGVILMRNVVERQQEFALMRAVGFRERRLSWMLILEHSGLLLAGLCIGLVSAVVAILPIVLAPGRPMAVDIIGLLLAVVLAVGLLAIVFAGRWAMSRRLIQGLRAE